LTSTNETVVTDEQAEWEKELADGAEGANVDSVSTPEPPKGAENLNPSITNPGPQPSQVGHPLGGEAVRFTDDVIDF